MKQGAALLFSIVLTALLSACTSGDRTLYSTASGGPVPPAYGAAIPAGNRVFDLNQCTMYPSYFVNNKVFYSPPFDFNHNGAPTGSSYSPPIMLPAQATDPDATPVMAAFTAAPSFLRKILCRMTGVLIDTSQTSNEPLQWAFWENADQTAGNVQGSGAGRWVALSEGLWNGTNTYSGYSLYKLNSLLSTTTGITFSSTPEGATLGLLGALAHEAGHVVYYDMCARTGQSCYSDMHSDTWYRVGKPARIRGMKDPYPDACDQDENSQTDCANNHVTRHYDKVVDDWNGGNTKGLLYGLYNGRKWLDVVSSAAPDEEFVELFELVVLTQANAPNNMGPLTAFSITLPKKRGDTSGATVPIVSNNYPSATLKAKYDFVSQTANAYANRP